MKSISVIIPAFNAENYITDALESVFKQTLRVDEIIVVDDGSTDKTVEVVERSSESSNREVKIISQDNFGAAKARNAGIKIAQGEWIAFLDADDLWRADKLKLQFDRLNVEPEAKMVFSDMSHQVAGKVVFNSYLHEKKYSFLSEGQIYSNLLHENFVFTPTVVVQKSILDELGGFDEKLQIAEDYDLWLRIANKNEILFVDEPLVVRRRTGENITDDKVEYIRNHICLWQKLLKDSVTQEEHYKIIQEKLKECHFNLGYELFHVGQRKESCYHFDYCLKSGYRRVKSAMYLFLGVFN